ncbi:MAG: hypothetical protein HY820_38775 [Acidobacteria bacterium]|nr:hypothetical protein [Acidobacteriota bacterium]
MAELLSDLVIACTGGSPSPKGGKLPQYQILVTSNTPLTLKIAPPPKPSATPVIDGPLEPVSSVSDALAIVDDPPATDQRPCVPVAPADFCSATGATDDANVFQGTRLQDNLILFNKIPIDAPGEGRTRILRVTNLRASASKIPKKPDPDQVVLTAQIFDSAGRQLSLENPTQVAGVARPGIIASLHTSIGAEVTPLSPALTATPALLPQNNPGSTQAFLVRFTEGFPSAFKRRNLGTTASYPGYVVTQADPGGPANTESGFYNASFPSDKGLDSAGLADSGTRLKAVLSQVPGNVHVWVSARDVETGTTNYATAIPRALLTYAGDQGNGPFSQNHPAHGDFALVYPDNNSLTLVWEVMASNSELLESIAFEIRIFSPNGVAQLGTSYIKMGLAPVSSGDTQSPHPSFLESPEEPIPGFRIVSTLSALPVTAVSAASLSGNSVAPDSEVSLLGKELSIIRDNSGAAPVTSIGDVKVDVIDNAGIRRTASLFSVSPNKINLLLNPETAAGQAAIVVRNGTRDVATGTVRVSAVAPGLYSAAGDGRGFALGKVISVTESGTQSADLARLDPLQEQWQAVPVELVAGAATFLRLYGSGIRGRSSLDAVTLRIGSQSIPVTLAGPEGRPGRDQVEAGPLPLTLAGKGELPVTLVVDGKTSNSLTVLLK